MHGVASVLLSMYVQCGARMALISDHSCGGAMLLGYATKAIFAASMRLIDDITSAARDDITLLVLVTVKILPAVSRAIVILLNLLLMLQMLLVCRVLVDYGATPTA